MPNPAVTSSTSPSVLEELMRRGLVATGGNIRSIPFADPTPVGDVNGQTGIPGQGTSPVSGDIPRPAGATPVMDANNQLVDPTTGAPLDEQSSNDWLKYLIGGAGIAGGAVLADMLRKRLGKGAIPSVEGETIDPLGPTAQTVEGEYTEVPEAAKALAGPRVALEQASEEATANEAAKALAERKGPTKAITTKPNSAIISATDSMSDVSPEELARAKEITRQLVANRIKGNAARAKQTNLKRRGGLPTGPTEEEGLLNTVIGILRKNGALRSIARAVP